MTEIELMEKQSELFDCVMDSCMGKNKYRYFFFGGAIRGGKTYAVLVLLCFLCAAYPGSKWHVIRKDTTVLKATTIPSFEKIIATDKRWAWNRDTANYHATFIPTGAKIFFKPESLAADPELNDFLGLESNGFFLEQIEELSEKLWKRAIERSGSWYLDKMPPSFIFSTFNPTRKWVKEFVHDKHVESGLTEPFKYIQALTSDNKYVTQDQWAAWENMDEQSYRNLIEGSWEFEEEGNTFIYSLRTKERKDKKPGYCHIVDGLEVDKSLPVIASFDFNVEPITSLVIQHANDLGWVSIINEFRLMNSDIFELCDRMVTEYPDAHWIVTGDATGRNRTAITRGNRNYYHFIKERLKLNSRQFRLPSQNPSVANTRVLCNSLLAKHPAYLISSTCKHLNADIKAVTVDENGDIDKKKDAHKTHLLDCWRYYNWQFHQNFLRNV